MSKLIIPEALKVLITEFESTKQSDINKKKKTEGDNSSIQYKHVINAFDFGNRENVFTSPSEKKFLFILPKLIAAERKKDINNLISLIRRSVCLYDWGSNKKSYKTYIVSFVKFIDTLNNSKSQSNKKIVDDVKIKNPGKLSEEENDQLEKDLQNEVFLHKKLEVKFKSRLRGQERTSGDKIWLPLDFIAKIYRKNDKSNNSPFSKWLDDLVDSIYIHYMDNKGIIKSVQFKKKEIHLEFLKNAKDDDSFDVYIIWSRKGHKRRVYTPTGEGNKKVPMTVKSISEIDIDHVKPIDLTLRELGENNKIDTLKLVSDTFKQLLNDISNDNQEEKTKNAIDTLLNDDGEFISKLSKDLQRIRKDSILRLMHSKYNENKSNGLTYKKILLEKGEKDRYIGILSYVDKDDNGSPLTIYQYLDENGIIRATANQLPEDVINISKEIIDYL